VLPFKKLYVLSYHEAPRTQPFLVFMNTWLPKYDCLACWLLIY
jgi:hypothetical protein